MIGDSAGGGGEERPAVTALLGLGSNLGDRDGNIRAALDLLAARGSLRVERLSTLRTTAPVGGPPQGDYRNGAALVETTLSARELLGEMKRTERELGRPAGGVRNGPRVVDLDLLLYGCDVIDGGDLTVPHPRMAERAFVLEPAAEIAGDLRDPVRGTSVREMWEALR